MNDPAPPISRLSSTAADVPADEIVRGGVIAANQSRPIIHGPAEV